ncbi:tail fiber domain-containing protein [Enterobacter hormaechei]|uniref:Tail fiber domain-containing protein n=1 Tax=Enterobacter hormaechei TaxID=158836 RepID=A0AAX3YY45_9ENTR|nr:tail fiber domain-containing protein [Enterobacter hormaechei]WMB09601.1 tail fiber domain-containing protein [Enterobacter hormaechei]
MTTYFTKEPLGSTSPYVLFDNAQNLDFAVNDITQLIWLDRFGKSRKTFWGMEQEFSAQLLNQQQRFNNFIQSSGYKVIGEYTDGPLTITDYNELIRYQDELWKLSAATSIPYTTTGNDAASWANDAVHFVSVGDAALRQELAASSGAGLVGIRQSNVYKETPFVSPEMYGALDTISAADTQALIDAFTAAKTMGVGVKLSRLYTCASNITLTAFISDVFGLGQGQTGIIFEAGLGIVVDNSSISGTRKAMRIVNTSLRTRGNRNATALKFTGTHTAKYGEQLKLTDVLFATDETGAFGWDCCVHLDKASQVFMDHCSMSGLGAVPTNCCIRLTNQSRDINFTNGCASDFLDFLDFTSGAEGVTVAFNHIIAGQRGIVSHDTGGNMIFVLGNHFNTSISAVELGEGTGLGSNHCKIANNFCIVYNKPGDESKPYVAFDICSNENVLSSNDVLLTGFTKDATHTRLRRNASATRSASNNTISNPISSGLTRGVVIATGAVNNQVFGNQRIGMTLANDIVDNGTNTKYWLLDSDNNAFLTGDIKLARPGMAGVRQLRVHTGLDTTTASGVLRFIGGADGVANDAIMESTFREVVTKTIRPSTTNAYSCGVSGAAWSGGFTQTAFTVTSDERSKTAPVEITDAMLDAWSEVKWCQYKFLDRVEEKGEDARWHFGVVAQRAVEAFARYGLDAFEFGFACYDEWGDQDEVVQHYEATPDLYDANGELVQPGNAAYSEVISPAKKAGSKYGIRYEEAFALEAELQRRNHSRLLKRVEALEKMMHG